MTTTNTTTTESRTVTMPDGLYRLKDTVRNPKADRRKRRDWTAVEFWHAGTIFAVETNERGMIADLPSMCLVSVKRPHRYDRLHIGVRDGDSESVRMDSREEYEAGPAIAAKLEPVPLTLDTAPDWFHSVPRHTSATLQELARRGLLTETQAIETMRALHDESFFPEDDDEDEG